MAGREPGTWWRQIGPLFTAGRGVATGRGLGEEEAAQAETIYLEHEEQLGREASSAAFQGQVGREEGMPSAKAASGPCLVPPPPSLQPWNPALLSSPRAEPVVSHSHPSPQLGAALPIGTAHQTAGFICCCMYTAPRHMPGIVRSFHLMTM